jgi:hypothetical protein
MASSCLTVWLHESSREHKYFFGFNSDRCGSIRFPSFGIANWVLHRRLAKTEREFSYPPCIKRYANRSTDCSHSKKATGHSGKLRMAAANSELRSSAASWRPRGTPSCEVTRSSS